MVESFKDKRTEEIFNGVSSRRARSFPANLHAGACRKLDQIHAAAALHDLNVPPGNMLEALKGGRKGFHSIRINDQWRIIFRWKDGAAHDVEMDYHS